MRTIPSKRAQATLEAAIILFYILLVLSSFWFGGPVQLSTQTSTDTNGILLAAEALDTIASTATLTAMSGAGARKDFVVHIPFNTVDISYGNGSYAYGGATMEGPHITMSILLYGDIANSMAERYWVDNRGDPMWLEEKVYNKTPSETPFYYMNVTRPLDFPMDPNYFIFCEYDARKMANDTRGAGTRFIFADEYNRTKSIRFCCEAGFNLNMYMKLSMMNPDQIAIRSRHYYSLPGEWDLGPKP